MGNQSFPSATVLIVDDFAGWRTHVRRILETGPELTIVGEASDGPTAVEKAAEFQPDIVVLDITLPAFSGIEAAKLIRQHSPKSAIVFLTQHDDQDIREAALAFGSVAYVLKVNG